MVPLGCMVAEPMEALGSAGGFGLDEAGGSGTAVGSFRAAELDAAGLDVAAG